MNEPLKPEDITPTTFKPYQPNPIFNGMPAYLKDPANYEKIQKALYDAGGSTCSHSELIEWTACKKCQQKQWNRSEMMQKLGFTSGTQYILWKKTMDYIFKHKYLWETITK